MNEKEIWKPITGYEGKYEVSNQGKVKSLSRTTYCGRNNRTVRNVGERIISTKNISQGYKKTDLFKGNIRKQFFVHRLVAHVFVPNPSKKPNVNHLDGNKLNNRAENLEWVTQKENVHHAMANGFKKSIRGDASPTSKLTWKEVRDIRKLSEEGVSSVVLAKMYGVHYNTINDVVKLKSWMEVESV